MDRDRQYPGADAGVIATFRERVPTGRRLIIYGDGTQTRDFVYVGDIAAANTAGARAPALVSREFNIGTGVEVGVLALIKEIARGAGVLLGSLAPIFAPARPAELSRSCPAVARARRELQLATPTSLADGLAPTIAWVREQLGICSRSAGVHASPLRAT